MMKVHYRIGFINYFAYREINLKKTRTAHFLMKAFGYFVHREMNLKNQTTHFFMKAEG